MFIRWPFTTLQNMNLNWLLQQMKTLIEKVNAFGNKITVGSVETLPAGQAASVTISGDLDEGLTFNFEIPRGNTGATGATGEKGEKGDPGHGIVYHAVCTTGASVTAKTAVSDSEDITALSEGDVIAVRFSDGNIAYSPTLQIDTTEAYPLMGWKDTSGNIEGAPLIDRNVTVLLRFDGTQFKILGAPAAAAVTDGVPKSGLLSALQASRLNFGYQEIPANTTTAVQISLTKNGAQPFVNVSAWAMTALTYELLTPGTDYEASMNIMATGNTTLTFRLLTARDYPVYVVVTGNAAVH